MRHARYIIGFIVLCCLFLIADRIATSDKTLGLGLIAISESFISWLKNGLLIDAFYTIFRVILGFLIALVFGVLVGLYSGRYSRSSSGAVHILNYLRAITPVALAPFFLVAFGISETSKVLLVSWGAFFPIWVSAHLGIKALSEEFVASAKLQGLSGFQLIKHFYLPATLSSSYPGARVAVGISFILVYISETLGADYGIGYQLKVAYDTFQIPRMTAALLLLGALGLIMDKIFVIVVRYLAPWIKFDKKHEN